MKRLNGYCGDKNFGFSWYETQRTADNLFVLGQFQIYANGEELLEKILDNQKNALLPETKKQKIVSENGENLIYSSNPKYDGTIQGLIYYINLDICYLKDNLEALKDKPITCTDEDKDFLYWKGCRIRGYMTYKEAEEWCEVDDDTISDEDIYKWLDEFVEEHKSEMPFGFNFSNYADIEHWNFFLFRNKNNTLDRIIYSQDNGKTVYEVQLVAGTVEKVLSELPDI